MYTVTVTEHMMIAHSLPDPFFGPAQGLHGATYVVDAEFIAEQLDEHNVVIDIGAASQSLKNTLAELNYKNLDEVEAFIGKITTTEFLSHYIHGQLRKDVQSHIKIKVTLHESHIASASYSD